MPWKENSKRTLSCQALDYTQCSQSTKYLFALGADLAVIHSPSSLFEIAVQAPQLQFENLMICCMTGKQSPQESKKLHASKGPVFKSSRAFWMEECPSPVRIKKALVHTTTPRNLNFASYRLTSPFGDVPRRFQTTLQTLKLQSLDHGNKRTFPRLPRHLP